MDPDLTIVLQNGKLPYVVARIEEFENIMLVRNRVDPNDLAGSVRFLPVACYSLFVLRRLKTKKRVELASTKLAAIKLFKEQYIEEELEKNFLIISREMKAFFPNQSAEDVKNIRRARRAENAAG